MHWRGGMRGPSFSHPASPVLPTMFQSDLRRRGFLARLATGTLALTGAAALDPSLAFADDAAPASDFDDGWTRRVAQAKHKAVFDSPEIGGGQALVHAWTYRAGYAAALGEKGDAVLPIVVLRHGATSLALDDAIWAKYTIGANSRVNDPLTKQPAVRNPWARRAPGDTPDPMVSALLGPEADPTVEGLVKSGVIVLTCDLAMRSFARMFAARGSGNEAEILAELRAAVLPGVIRQPSGIYAVTRAQEAGATFVKST